MPQIVKSVIRNNSEIRCLHLNVIDNEGKEYDTLTYEGYEEGKSQKALERLMEFSTVFIGIQI